MLLLATSLPKNRYIAALTHFLFSVIVFAFFVGVLLVFWFPNPYFSASGGWQGLRIVAAVDLALGPLITLIIFNTKKPRKELMTDIGIIVVIQFAALFWGLKAVYDQHPIAVAFLDSSFYTVPAAALQGQDSERSDLERFGAKSPVFVFVQRPDSGAELDRFIEMLEVQRIPPHEQAWLYQGISENFSRISRSSLDIEEIMATNVDMKQDIEALLAKTRTSLHDNFYIALTSRYRNVVLVFTADGELLGSVNAPYKKGDV
jgi:hypothetical protein